jgi:uncharacterized membrane protein (DUF2068 family)
MQSQHPPTFRGRTLGITTLTVLQLFIGAIHVFFGFWLLTASNPFSTASSSTAYSFYTVAFGFLAAIFAFGIWSQKKWGTYATILLSLFVIVVDSLTVLNLPSIPGIPKFAAGTEIGYSLIVTLYIVQTNIRKK